MDIQKTFDNPYYVTSSRRRTKTIVLLKLKTKHLIKTLSFQFTKLRASLKNLQPHHYVILFGNLGCGKKWLAIDVCKDYGVLKSMDFSIHWLDMSDCISPEKDLEKLRKFANTFNIDTNQPKDVLIKDIKTAIKNNSPKCLLVLFEVQNKHIIKLFDFDTKVLITTRNKNVRDNFSKNSSTILTIGDSITISEGTELLQKVLKEQEIQYDSCTDKILEKTKNHPYILSIVARDLEGKPREVWKNAIYDSATNNMMNTKIHDSLNVFSVSEKDVFDHLVVFQHSVAIPLNVISKLCDKDVRSMVFVLEKFQKFSVVELSYLKNSIRVFYQRYIYFQYLRNNSPLNGRIAEVHRKLVNIYEWVLLKILWILVFEILFAFSLEENLENPKDSTSFIENDHYFYSFIGYHLQKAGMESLLQRLYLDFRFLGQSIKANGCQKTFGDFERYKEEIVGKFFSIIHIITK